MIDRDLSNRKKALGVELFDLIEAQSKSKAGAVLSTPAAMKTIEREIRGPLNICTEEVYKLYLEKKDLESQLELLEARQEREKFSSENSWTKRVADSAKETKIWAQLKLIENQIKSKKEKFGLEVWDVLAQPAWLHDAMKQETAGKQGIGSTVGGVVDGVVKGTKGTVGKLVGKLSSDERQVEQVVKKAKDDIQFLEESKRRKLAEIDRIINKQN
jgi:hypothetical protein